MVKVIRIPKTFDQNIENELDNMFEEEAADDAEMERRSKEFTGYVYRAPDWDQNWGNLPDEGYDDEDDDFWGEF